MEEQAAADKARYQKARADAACRRRGQLELTTVQTERGFVEEQERAAAMLRAEEQAQKYQRTIDEAARRRARRAELAAARSNSVVHE